MQQSDLEKERYMQAAETQRLSDLRKQPLLSKQYQIFIFNSILEGLDAYLKRGGRVGEFENVLTAHPKIDLDRTHLIRYLITAKGGYDHKSETGKMAAKILNAMNQVGEDGEHGAVISFQTDSAYFLRFTMVEVQLFLLSAMINEHIPIPHYFDGEKLYNRSTFSETEWARFNEAYRNRMELNRLAHGLQP